MGSKVGGLAGYKTDSKQKIGSNNLKVIIAASGQVCVIFMSYFKSGTEVRIPGRLFPVDVIYDTANILQELEQYEVKAVAKAISLHRTEGQGDILVFLASPIEIMRCLNEFEKRVASTAAGIKFVIDSGFSKDLTFDPKKNIFLEIQANSQSSCDQRKDKAGRTSSGKCFRLYSENTYMSMATSRKPRILAEPLGQVLLKLAELGTEYEFDFLDPPSKELLLSTLQLLQHFCAVTPKGITEIGQWMSRLGLDPRLGYIIYLGYKENLLSHCVTIAGLITHGSDIFYKDFSALEDRCPVKLKAELCSEHGDLFTWLKIYHEWVQLPRSEHTSWCHTNKINYKVLNFIKHFISDIEALLTKEMTISLEHQSAISDHDLNNLRRIIFLAYSSHTCKTSKSFYKKGLLPVDEEWVLKTNSQGNLPFDLDKTKTWKAQLVHREELGSATFQHLVGARYLKLQKLEDILHHKGLENVCVEADKQLGTLEIYSSCPMTQDASKCLAAWKSEVMVKLLEDEEELQVMKGSDGKDQTGIRVLLEKGARARAILMPEQSNKIIITNARSQNTTEEVFEKFKLYGDIKECSRMNHPQYWGYVEVKNKFEAKLVWCRRPIKGIGTAIINCPPIERAHLTGKTITVHDRQLKIESSNKEESTELAIMEAVKKRFEEIKTELNKLDLVKVNYRQMKQGDCALDIISSNAENLLHARDMFQTELQGDNLDLSGSEHLASIVKRKGEKVINDIGMAHAVVVITDDRQLKIHIYGDVENVKRAKSEISSFLESLRRSVSIDFLLRGTGKPPGLSRALFTKYSPFPDNMIDAFELNHVALDLMQLKLTLVGTLESIQKALLSITELEAGLPKIDVAPLVACKPQCALCKSFIDNLSEMYRLECCGHSYCQACIKVFLLLSVQDRKFPLRCALGTCNQLLVVRDIRYFLNKKWLPRSLLVLRCLQSFVAENVGMYKFCLTPNCPVTYEVTDNEEGSEFNCPACLVSLCTSCHEVFHAGLPCRN
ncbi:hypothetical protein Btru_077078 [Bulinus truncatus]|nr:hypothetical protein Btru_077078 [Bulinus truncatus]